MIIIIMLDKEKRKNDMEKKQSKDIHDNERRKKRYMDLKKERKKQRNKERKKEKFYKHAKR